MRNIIIDDFIKQRKNLTALLLAAIPTVAVGFAFQTIYYYAGVIFAAGFSIIYYNCFFDYWINISRAEKESKAKENPIIAISNKKLQLLTKYVEIVIVTFAMYVFMSVVYVLDAFDRNRFDNPYFSFTDHIDEIMLFPILFMLLVSVFTPVLISKKINKPIFVGLAIISILMSCGVFILDFFLKFTEKEMLMNIISLVVVGLMFISLFVSNSIASKRY